MKKLILNMIALLLSLFSFGQDYFFTGNRFDEGVYLQWENSSEKYDQYIIKRSRNNNVLIPITTIDIDKNQKEVHFVDQLFFSNYGVISYQLIGVKNEQKTILASFFVEDIYERVIEVSPNPTMQGFVEVAISGIEYEQGVIDVYTPMGEIIYTNSFELTSKKEIQLIDTKNFNYRKKLYLRVQMANSVKIVRLLF